MSAGTSPPASAGGVPLPVVFQGGRRTCSECQVQWLGSEPCWVCGAEVQPQQTLIYPHPYYYG
jgi:predicted amidophosphoribosyltransferase